jgi:hypothetical protein
LRILRLPIAVGSICLFLFSCNWFSGRQTKDDLQDQVLALESVQMTINRLPFPWGWDLCAFFSNGLLNGALRSIAGLGGTLSKQGIDVQLIDANLQTNLAQNSLTLHIEVQRKGVKVELKAIGRLVYRDIELRGDPAYPSARFQIAIDHIALSSKLANLFPLSVSLGEDVISHQLIEQFLRDKYVSLKLQWPRKIPATFQRSIQQIVNDGKTTVKFTASLPGGIFEVPITFALPVVTPQGIWILASISGDNPVSPDGQGLPSDVSDLKKKRDEIYSAIKGRVSVDEVNGVDAAVWIKSTVFDKALFQNINKLSSDQRTARINLDSASGHVAEKTDKALGMEGGYWVDAVAASAEISLGAVNSHWSEGQGLQMALPVSADADAKLNVHIDPYIGGGFTLEGVNLVGSGDPAVLSGVLRLKVVSTTDGSGVLFGPVVDCTATTLRVTTGGSLKLGIEQGLLLGDTAVRPSVLFESAPYYEDLRQFGGSDFVVSHLDAPLIKVQTVPMQAGIPQGAVGRNGYWVTTQVELTRVSDEVDAHATKSEREALDDALEDAWDGEFQPTCPTKPETKVLFAGAEFGPNNEIVKFLGQAGHNATMAKIRLEQVIKDPSSAGSVLKDVAGNVVNEGIVKPVQKVAHFLGF